MLIVVRTVPRSSRAAVDGVRNDALLVRVTAAPVDGAANAAVVEVLADAFGVPRSAIEIIRGTRGRNKVVAIRGTTRGEIEERIRDREPENGD